MIVPDTCIWIEFLKHKEPVYSTLMDLIKKNQVMACEIVFAELMQGARDLQETNRLSLFWELLPKHNLDGLMISAGAESANKKYLSKGIGLIDVIIMHYAVRLNLKIWTIDKNLKSIIPLSYQYQTHKD